MNKQPFKPYLLDIWSNNRYFNKEGSDAWGHTKTIKITENISENLLSDILNAAGNVLLSTDPKSEEYNHAIGYEIREMQDVPFLVVLHSNPTPEATRITRSIIVMAADEEEARTKTETFIRTNESNKPLLEDITGFDTNVTGLSDEEYSFLTKRTSLVTFILTD